MDRRCFLTALAPVFLAPVSAWPQPTNRPPRVAFIEAGAPSANPHFLNAFRQGLRDLGYVEGKNITIEDRWADGLSERFPALLDEMLRFGVDVIVQASTSGALAARRATTTVPVVFWGVTDPVGLGLVNSLGHPGGNITGLALAFEDEFPGKWVEILKTVVPRVSQVGVLLNPNFRGPETRLKELTEPAAQLGLTLHRFPVSAAGDFDAAFAEMRRRLVDGLIVITDPLTLRHRARVVELVAKARLPAVYGFGEFARAGGLVAYGPAVVDLARRAATYVDKILKGAKPADLPVERPTKFELIINLKAAKAIGLTIPPSLLARADQVID